MLRVINLQTGAIVAAYELRDETQTFLEFNPHAETYPAHLKEKHELDFKDMLAKRSLHNEACRRQARQLADNLNSSLPQQTHGHETSLFYVVVNTGDKDEHLKPYFDITVNGN